MSSSPICQSKGIIKIFFRDLNLIFSIYLSLLVSLVSLVKVTVVPLCFCSILTGLSCQGDIRRCANFERTVIEKLLLYTKLHSSYCCTLYPIFVLVIIHNWKCLIYIWRKTAKNLKWHCIAEDIEIFFQQRPWFS